MPTYEYECPNCGKKVDIFHGMMEHEKYICNYCGAELFKRVSGGTATLYKSPGFTLYKGRNGS